MIGIIIYLLATRISFLESTDDLANNSITVILKSLYKLSKKNLPSDVLINDKDILSILKSMHIYLPNSLCSTLTKYTRQN